MYESVFLVLFVCLFKGTTKGKPIQKIPSQTWAVVRQEMLPYLCFSDCHCDSLVTHRECEHIRRESQVICGGSLSNSHNPCVGAVLAIRLNFSVTVFRTFSGKRRKIHKDLLARSAANHQGTGSPCSCCTFLSSPNHNQGAKN